LYLSRRAAPSAQIRHPFFAGIVAAAIISCKVTSGWW
jgi:hypothetical protein